MEDQFHLKEFNNDTSKTICNFPEILCIATPSSLEDKIKTLWQMETIPSLDEMLYPEEQYVESQFLFTTAILSSSGCNEK